MKNSLFAVPVADRCFEDYELGSTARFGPIAVSEEEIIDFARRYDPQRIHIDPVAAVAGPFRGLIASGWHTVGLVMRALVEGYLAGEAGIASPGIDELRWVMPVRPGDTLEVEVTVVETKRSQSKPDRGMVRTRIEAFNQDGGRVLSMVAMNLFRCRDGGRRGTT